MAKPRAKSKAEPPPPQPINTYGIDFGAQGTQTDYDRAAYVLNLPFEKTGMTRAQLFRKFSDVVSPGYFEWHDWTKRQIEAMTTNRWIGLAGCSNSAKTHNVVGFAVNWWLMDSDNSAVILCSTSLKAMRRRCWANVQQCHQTYPSRMKPGNMIDSRIVWQARPGDDKHAIVGVAVEEGSVTKAADKIKGHHTIRLMVIIDEATAIPPAIFEACYNLYSYPASQPRGEFVMVVIGNPRAKTDQMGLFCTPFDGWQSVNIDMEEWETVEKFDGRRGVCIRFDACKSPNLRWGRVVSQHLPTKEMVQAAMAKAGSENDPSFWSNMRGMWPPDDLAQTVFNMTMLTEGKALDMVGGKKIPPHQFTGRNIQIFGGFDPAFGGKDKPAIRFIQTGELVGGGTGIQFMPPMYVPLDATKNEPIHYQLAQGARRLCEKHHCPSDHLNVDDSGNTGVCDIFYREWGRVLRTRFGNNASESPALHQDGKTAREIYRNRATEVWFTGRDFVMTGMVRGLDPDTARQLCTRLYYGGSDNARNELEPKDDYKQRNGGESPDEADAAMLACDAARRCGVKVAPGTLQAVNEKNWEKEEEKAQRVWGEPDHSADNFEESEEVLV